MFGSVLKKVETSPYIPCPIVKVLTASGIHMVSMCIHICMYIIVAQSPMDSGSGKRIFDQKGFTIPEDIVGMRIKVKTL